MEHKKEKRNERAAIQLGLFLVGLLLFGTVAGGQLTGKEKNGKEKAAIQTSGVVSDAVEPKKIALTFDDGPHPVYTKILLDGLAERGAKASCDRGECRKISGADFAYAEGGTSDRQPHL